MVFMVKLCSNFNLMVENQLEHGGEIYHFPMLNATSQFIQKIYACVHTVSIFACLKHACSDWRNNLMFSLD